MKKLIALIPTKGKTEKQIVAEMVAQAKAKGFLIEEQTTPRRRAKKRAWIVGL